VPLSVTPTPTATPTPRPPWDPGRTVDDAASALGMLVEALGTLAIWLLVVGAPFAVPLAVVYLWYRRRQRGQ
jgi:hypothetical protein